MKGWTMPPGFAGKVAVEDRSDDAAETRRRMGGAFMLRAMLDLQNQIRALRGEDPLTLDQYRAELAAKL